MGAEERMRDLARKAKLLTGKGLSVQEQFAALTQEGLTLTDINWENSVSHPGAETVISVRRPPEASGAPAK